MTQETKVISIVTGLTILILIVGLFFISKSNTDSQKAEVIDQEVLNSNANHQIKSDNAVASLVEFSDFQCPACGAYKPVVDQILEKYKGKITFTYRHFPLPQHEFAIKAAEASEAADEQGKFWEMYSYLFANQGKLSEELIANSGKSIGLDEQKFQEALKSGKFNDRVRQDLTDGNRLGVNSTPTFYLNGKKLVLKSMLDLEKAVEQETKK